MKYIDEYRDKQLVLSIAAEIRKISGRPVAHMEVCGGHTMSIQRFGIPSLLPPQIRLLSGPGCPVCVSSRKFIDQAIAYSRLEDVIITTYGDLIRVPGACVASSYGHRARTHSVRPLPRSRKARATNGASTAGGDDRRPTVRTSGCGSGNRDTPKRRPSVPGLAFRRITAVTVTADALLPIEFPG